MTTVEKDLEIPKNKWKTIFTSEFHIILQSPNSLRKKKKMRGTMKNRKDEDEKEKTKKTKRKEENTTHKISYPVLASVTDGLLSLLFHVFIYKTESVAQHKQSNK
jgi:hypothetical protein